MTSQSKHKEDLEKQETDEGYEIPVPKRREFFENLEKASKPDAEDEDDSDGSSGGEAQE